MFKRITLDDIRGDPYGFTYKEYIEAMGEAEAKEAFALLYRRKVHPQNQTISVKTVYRGGDTDKYLFELSDGKYIETVCIKRRDGATVCVSTQVGCPVGCMFCESGKNGFVRNQTPAEIVQQEVLLDRKITRIVYMGMGEPLFNYENVIKSIHILRDRNGLNFPTDGITLSTTGPLDRLKRLREEHLKIQLTLSLHATTQTVRNKIIPGMKGYPIHEVVESVLSYSERHNRKIVIAYLLLPGINDSPTDVRNLARWFRGKNVMINLLEYNKTSASTIRKPTRQEIGDFKRRLEAAGLSVTMRVSHGGNIKAACGQLANQHNRKTGKSNLLNTNRKER